MFWLPKDPFNRQQWRLRNFYIGAYAILVLEGLAAVSWVIQMFVLKFRGNAQYRLINVLFLFHLGAATALASVVQQAQNNNSVLWWNIFVFLTAVFGDLETLLELSIGNITKAQPWAWGYLLYQAILHLALTLATLLWYFAYRELLPKPMSENRKPLLQ